MALSDQPARPLDDLAPAELLRHLRLLVAGDDRDVALRARERRGSPVPVVSPPGGAVELRLEDVEAGVGRRVLEARLRRSRNVLGRREHRRERFRLAEDLAVEECAEERREIAARRYQPAASVEVHRWIDAR